MPDIFVNEDPHLNQSFESVEEDVPDLNELVSPRRPAQSPRASPRALLIPDQQDIGEVL